MQARGKARRNGFGGQDGAERQTGGEGLGDEDDVGFRGKLLVGEVAAGATQATLNFVGAEQSAVRRGAGAGAIPEGLGAGMEAAFSLAGFEDAGPDGVGEFGFTIAVIAE